MNELAFMWLIGLLALVALTIVWIALPFIVMGTNSRLDRVVRELRESNQLLKEAKMLSPLCKEAELANGRLGHLLEGVDYLVLVTKKKEGAGAGAAPGNAQPPRGP